MYGAINTKQRSARTRCHCILLLLLEQLGKDIHYTIVVGTRVYTVFELSTADQTFVKCLRWLDCKYLYGVVQRIHFARIRKHNAFR